jgi:integral membrane protein
VSDPKVSAALLRYRIIAIVVGTVLVVLSCVAVPLKYAADKPAFSDVGWPIHGALFIFYCAAALALAIRCKWSTKRTLLVMLAGTIPVMTFVAERQVTKDVQGSLPVG